MAEIAQKAGVSKNTVSLALRNDSRIRMQTRQKIQALAASMGYQKNPLIARLMVQLRQHRVAKYRPTLALVNANRDPAAFETHPTIPVYLEGCRNRAEALGYELDPFWLHDPELNARRFHRILRARNIEGLLIIGLMDQNRLPERFAETWEQFPAVVTGARTRDPALSFACTDHHMLTVRAVEHAWELGYRKPALVIDRSIEHLVEGRFSAGYFTALQRLGADRIIPPFNEVEAARKESRLFADWLRAYQPDLILTLYPFVLRWLSSLKLVVPEDIGLILLEHRPQQPWISGMNQHNDVVGASALEMLVAMVQQNQSGIPTFPKATLIGSTWIEGKTAVLQK